METPRRSAECGDCTAMSQRSCVPFERSEREHPRMPAMSQRSGNTFERSEREHSRILMETPRRSAESGEVCHYQSCLKKGRVMTKVKMLQTRKGTEDGFTVKQFARGEIYEIRESLARSFFAAGFAEKVRNRKVRTGKIKK